MICNQIVCSSGLAYIPAALPITCQHKTGLCGSIVQCNLYEQHKSVPYSGKHQIGMKSQLGFDRNELLWDHVICWIYNK